MEDTRAEPKLVIPDKTQAATADTSQCEFAKNNIENQTSYEELDRPLIKQDNIVLQMKNLDRKKRQFEDGLDDERPSKVLRTFSDDHSKTSEDANYSEDRWNEDMHKWFTSAIMEIGLKHSSPLSILENMVTKRTPELTCERLKSHLQKYRHRWKKEKDNFLNDYDMFIQTIRKTGSLIYSSSSLIATQRLGILLGGKAAALLSHSVMMDSCQDSSVSNDFEIPDGQRSRMHNNEAGFPAAFVSFPMLTEEEQESHLGRSLALLKHLFDHITRYLMTERYNKILCADPRGILWTDLHSENLDDADKAKKTSHEGISPCPKVGIKSPSNLDPVPPLQIPTDPFLSTIIDDFVMNLTRSI